MAQMSWQRSTHANIEYIFIPPQQKQKEFCSVAKSNIYLNPNGGLNEHLMKSAHKVFCCAELAPTKGVDNLDIKTAALFAHQSCATTWLLFYQKPTVDVHKICFCAVEPAHHLGRFISNPRFGSIMVFIGDVRFSSCSLYFFCCCPNHWNFSPNPELET